MPPSVDPEVQARLDAARQAADSYAPNFYHVNPDGTVQVRFEGRVFAQGFEWATNPMLTGPPETGDLPFPENRIAAVDPAEPEGPTRDKVLIYGEQITLGGDQEIHAVIRSRGRGTFPGTIVTRAERVDATGAILARSDRKINDSDGDSDFALDNQERTRVYRSTTQSLPNNTLTAISFDSTRWDTHGFHDPAVNPTRLTMRGKPGLYYCYAHLTFNAHATGFREVILRVNGGAGPDIAYEIDSPGSAAFGQRIGVGTAWVLDSFDYMEVMARQNSGAALTVLASSATGAYNADAGMARL